MATVTSLVPENGFNLTELLERLGLGIPMDAERLVMLNEFLTNIQRKLGSAGRDEVLKSIQAQNPSFGQEAVERSYAWGMFSLLVNTERENTQNSPLRINSMDPKALQQEIVRLAQEAREVQAHERERPPEGVEIPELAGTAESTRPHTIIGPRHFFGKCLDAAPMNTNTLLDQLFDSLQIGSPPVSRRNELETSLRNVLKALGSKGKDELVQTVERLSDNYPELKQNGILPQDAYNHGLYTTIWNMTTPSSNLTHSATQGLILDNIAKLFPSPYKDSFLTDAQSTLRTIRRENAAKVAQSTAQASTRSFEERVLHGDLSQTGPANDNYARDR